MFIKMDDVKELAAILVGKTIKSVYVGGGTQPLVLYFTDETVLWVDAKGDDAATTVIEFDSEP